MSKLSSLDATLPQMSTVNSITSSFHANGINQDGPDASQKLRQSYQHMAKNVLNRQGHDIGEALPPRRHYLHNILDSPSYQTAMGIIILTNVVSVIHETDLKASADADIPGWLSASSVFFLWLYIVEVAVRLYTYQLRFFVVGWNVLDISLVITDTCLELTKIWAGGDAPSVSILRIFRLARLLRLIAMISFLQELQTMLLGFGSAMKAMVWASFMIGGVVTVCSIVAVEFIHPLNQEVAKTGVYDDCRRCARAFETVAESNLTFIQQIIAGDSWGKITIPIIEAYPASGIFFLIVFGLIDLGVLNLILTVIVNAAESAREKNHVIQLMEKSRQIEHMKNSLKKLCANLDDDRDGKISLKEFMEGVDKNEDFAATLALLDIQKQDADIVFNLMDEDGSGEVEYNEFVHTMITTKHEPINTKLLFLKAGQADIRRDLRLQRKVISDDVGEKLVEIERLTRKLDQRWELLQMEQAKHFRMLEKVLAEVTPQPPVGRSFARPAPLYPLPSLNLPPSPCTCEMGYSKQSRIVSGNRTPDPERKAEPEGASRAHAPEGIVRVADILAVNAPPVRDSMLFVA